MPTIKMTSQGLKTSSYTIAREECEVGCILLCSKCSKSTPAHVAIWIISKTSFLTKWTWILLSLPQTTGYCCHNIPNQCWPLYIVKTNLLQWQQLVFCRMTFINTSVTQTMMYCAPSKHDSLMPMHHPQSACSCGSETTSCIRWSIILFDLWPIFTL